MYVSNTSGEKSNVKINKEENDYNIIFNKQKAPNVLGLVLNEGIVESFG